MSTQDSIDLRSLKSEIENAEKVDYAQPTVAVVSRDLEIEVRYMDPSGTPHVGVVISRIKTGQQRAQVGQIAASLTNGAPWESLPPVIAARTWALANSTIHLQDPPDWVLKWMQEDDSLLFGLATQLEEHESTYFRGHPEQGKGAEGEQRVVVRPKSSAPNSSKPTSTNVT